MLVHRMYPVPLIGDQVVHMPNPRERGESWNPVQINRFKCYYLELENPRGSEVTDES